MSLRIRRGWAAVGMVVVLGSVAGCGSDPYKMAPVRGRITCQGKPATGGIVIFQPLDAPDRTGRPAGHTGMASSGVVEADGSFTLTAMDGRSGPGALVGPHQVLFQPPPTRRPTLSADDRAAMTPDEVRAAEEELRNRPVYPPLPCGNKPTPEEVEVKPGDNVFEFTLGAK